MTRAALLLVMLAGCAEPGCRPMLAAELLFGLSRPGGVVDDRAFTAFLDERVTPRFPAGLTAVDAAGRWRAPDGRLSREFSKRVLILAPLGAETRARLEAIRGEYKSRFGQQAVGLMVSRTCADF